jgi:alpha-ketoglutaric semialdehyde dehydrogenase
MNVATTRGGPTKNYVGGEWRASTSTYTKQNPTHPSKTVGEFADSNEMDVGAAVTAAAAAFSNWAALPLSRRAGYLEAAAESLTNRAEQIAHDMAQEMGKPIREARGEVARAATILRYAASEAFRPVGQHYEQTATGAQVSTRRRPIGVVGLITPWNFPIAIPVWKLAPALIYGNTVVIKLAFEAPLSGLHIATAFADAALPAGVLNVLTGRGATAGAALVRDPRVCAISFTGSVATGHSVRDEATRLGKRVQLELGGQNPMIVMADADLERAVEAAFVGAFWSAGQKCTATRRIYVQANVYEQFRERFLARVEHARVGDPLDPETEVGPIVTEAQLDAVLAAIERATEEGGSLLAGGERADSDGYLLAPTVFEAVRDDAFLSCNEVFGPVVSLYRFENLDEALRRANAVPLGLAAAIFTTDLAAATRFAAEAEAGLIHVNSQTAGAEVHVPFGGIKDSGFGPHEQGQAAVEFYTDQITVYVDP